MYATCLFCNEHLGRNEALEHFPVGRRLAFDSAQGRLWVICPECSRWNLSPLETRWEAIEEAERAFRGTRLRSSTTNIGLAKLREGTTLVRIGQPLLPEFAGWRYGSVFRRRWIRGMVWGLTGSAAALTGAGAVILGGPTVATNAVLWSAVTVQFAHLFRDHRRTRTARLTLRGADGQPLYVSKNDLGGSRIVPQGDREWSLHVTHQQVEAAGRLRQLLGIKRVARPVYRRAELSGVDAVNALRMALPAANDLGSGKTHVDAAVDLVLARPNLVNDWLSLPTEYDKRRIGDKPRLLENIPIPVRFALEMTLHEADERRALDGELQELEARWREADEIARIADRLLVPAHIDEQRRALPP